MSKATDVHMDDTDDKKAEQQLALKTRLVKERVSYFRTSRERFDLITKFPVKEKEKAPAEQMKTATINFISDCEDEWLAMSLERRQMKQQFEQQIRDAEAVWNHICYEMTFIEHFADLCFKIQIDQVAQDKAQQELREWHDKEDAECKTLLTKAGLSTEPKDEEDEEDEPEKKTDPVGDMTLALKEIISYISLTCSAAVENKKTVDLDWMSLDHVLRECWGLWCAVRADMQSYNKVFSRYT